MKTDVKQDIQQALLSNTELVSIIGQDKDGNDRIYDTQVAPLAKEYPRITMFEVTNLDRDFADDVPISSEIIVQIDVWTKTESDRSQIASLVDKTMKENGWRRGSAVDFYEKDIDVFHKAMRYRNKFEEE